jgi:hypothetical protein
MKHNPRKSNPTPTLGSKPDLRKAQMTAAMNPSQATKAAPGKQSWLQGVSVESVMARPKRP